MNATVYTQHQTFTMARDLTAGNKAKVFTGTVLTNVRNHKQQSKLIATWAGREFIFEAVDIRLS